MNIDKLKHDIHDAEIHGVISPYISHQINGYLQTKSETATALELVDAKASLIAAQSADLLNAEQIGAIFQIAPEVSRA